MRSWLFKVLGRLPREPIASSRSFPMPIKQTGSEAQHVRQDPGEHRAQIVLRREPPDGRRGLLERHGAFVVGPLSSASSAEQTSPPPCIKVSYWPEGHSQRPDRCPRSRARSMSAADPKLMWIASFPASRWGMSRATARLACQCSTDAKLRPAMNGQAHRRAL